MANEMEAPDNVHTMHPSLAVLGGKLNTAKQGLEDASAEKQYSQKRVATAKNLMSEDLGPFKNKGEKMFKVLYDGIGLYEDQELENETFSVMLEKDSIIPGTYIDNKTVLFGDPYNVYCSAINVEPTDITHSEYKNNKHEYDQTVIINVEDFDQLQIENNQNEDANVSSDFIVVDEQNKSSAAGSEFEAINASDAQSSQEIQVPPTPPTVPLTPPTPPPVAQPTPPVVPPVVPSTPPTPPVNNYEEQEEEEEEEEEEEDLDESSRLLGNNNNHHLSGMPPPPTSPSSSIGKHGRYSYQNAPAVATNNAVIVDNDNNNNNNEQEEMKGHATNVSDRMSMDDIKLVDDINNEYANDVMPSTGNILEDLDNLLRIYSNLSNEKERELVYKEFWDKYDAICSKQAWLLLCIPTRVRGLLAIMNGDMIAPKMEAYRQDRIMMHVLSRNGLLEEPDYIRNRYLYTYFIQYEIFNYFKWFCSNCGGVQSWMFLFLWLLMFAQIIHIGIDFGRGNPWRAILMECLVPLTFIASIQFVNTPFTANILRTMIENKCAALCNVYGRVSLNILILFFCLGSLELQDVLLLFASLLCSIWTAVVFVSFTRLNHASNYVRIATGRVDKLQEKFSFANENKDGVLTHIELRNFFKSYNQIVPIWQIDLMISQYDIHRDGGLRFDALRLWFEKIPINHLTRINLLAAKSSYDINNAGVALMTTTTNNINASQMTTTGQIVLQSEQQKPQYTEAEKEWLGLAGRKYMNQ